MSDKTIRYMDLVKRTHAMHNAFSFIDFDYTINSYFGIWYAEERLYVVHDCMTDAYYFVEARDPHGAIKKVLDRIEEAEHAGEYVEEEK